LNRISSYGDRGEKLYCIQDSAAAVEHVLLLAVDNGLGACWVGAFDENEVSKILNLPLHVRPVAIIPIGYPKGRVKHTSRIDTKILTHHNKW
jgi:nitroreductase